MKSLKSRVFLIGALTTSTIQHLENIENYYFIVDKKAYSNLYSKTSNADFYNENDVFIIHFFEKTNKEELNRCLEILKQNNNKEQYEIVEMKSQKQEVKVINSFND